MIDELDDYWTQIGDWTESILSGSVEESCALLITLLPNLESIIILDDPSPQTPLFDVISKITDTRSVTDQTFLPALTKIPRANGSNSRGGQSLGLLGPLAVLPSMRSLHGSLIRDAFDKDSFTWCHGPRIPGIIDIRYSCTSISAESFCQLFSVIKALESFSCIGGGVSRSAEWEPVAIVDGLRVNAKGSLRKLDLTFSKEDDADNECYGIASLDTFELLRWVRLDVELLFNVTSDAVVTNETTPDGYFLQEQA